MERLIRYRAHSADELRLLLYRIARNRLADRGRSSQSRPHLSLAEHDGGNEPSSTSPDPLRQAESGQMLSLLRQALFKLPERAREVYLLNRITGMSSHADRAALWNYCQDRGKHIARALQACARNSERIRCTTTGTTDESRQAQGRYAVVPNAPAPGWRGWRLRTVRRASARRSRTGWPRTRPMLLPGSRPRPCSRRARNWPPPELRTAAARAARPAPRRWLPAVVAAAGVCAIGIGWMIAVDGTHAAALCQRFPPPAADAGRWQRGHAGCGHHPARPFRLAPSQPGAGTWPPAARSHRRQALQLRAATAPSATSAPPSRWNACMMAWSKSHCWKVRWKSAAGHPAHPGARPATQAAVGPHPAGPSSNAAAEGWLQGQLVFDATPLSIVVERMNRYATRRW